MEISNFSPFLYRMGLECPTRLYYDQHSEYPRNQEDRELIRHIQFNKHQLIALTRSFFPDGTLVKGSKRSDISQKTRQHLQDASDCHLFNAIIQSGSLYARFPILIKEDDKISIYSIRTKSFNARKHKFAGEQGKIYGKWKNYFIDLAFGVYLVQQEYSFDRVDCYLVLPDKSRQVTVNFHKYLSITENDRVEGDYKLLSNLKDQINFLHFFNVNRYVRKILNSKDREKELHPAWEDVAFEERIQQMRELYQKGEKYPPVLGMHCRGCPFRVKDREIGKQEKSGFNECWSERIDEQQLQQNEHIFNLTGHGTEKYLNKGYLTLDQVPVSDRYADSEQIANQGSKFSFDQRQALQLLKVRGQEVPDEIIKEGLFEEIKQWVYPLFFLDFEAANFAVPFRAGGYPYDPVIFQYSCHVLHENGALDHFDWIESEPGAYPSYELIRNLMRIPDIEKGTILQYSQFEKRMLKFIRKMLKNDIKQDYEPGDHGTLMKWLHQMLDESPTDFRREDRFVDMSRLVRDYYFHRKMDGSLGLKEVISAMISTSETLQKEYSQFYKSKNFEPIQWWQKTSQGRSVRNPYDIIDALGTGINSGDEVLMAFARLQREDMDENVREKLVDALLKYCELDTLSMVMIFQHWQEKKNTKVFG